MLALHSGATGIGHVEAVVVVIAILTAIFWREMVKIFLMVALLLFIIFVTSGAVATLDVLNNTQKQQSKFSHKLDRWLPRTPQSAWPDSGHEHITHTHTYICVCCLHKKHRAATSEIPAPPTRGGGGARGRRASGVQVRVC
jgi:hypothetical protein